MPEGIFRLRWTRTKEAVLATVYYDPDTAVDMARAVALVTGRSVEVQDDRDRVLSTVGPDEWEAVHAPRLAEAAR